MLPLLRGLISVKLFLRLFDCVADRDSCPKKEFADLHISSSFLSLLTLGSKVQICLCSLLYLDSILILFTYLALFHSLQRI